uniref:RDD family protein n=1 Tax=Marivita sp. TaxID=2003365 RepID=UPI003F6F8AD6
VTIKRGLAWVIDAALILALVVPIVVMTLFIALWFLPLLFFVVGFIYRVATITNRSATWGMRLMSIEFRDRRGEYFDFSQAFMHTLGYTVSMSIFPLQLISIAMMFLTERGQGLTDMMLGTVAINRRAY